MWRGTGSEADGASVLCILQRQQHRGGAGLPRREACGAVRQGPVEEDLGGAVQGAGLLRRRHPGGCLVSRLSKGHCHDSSTMACAKQTCRTFLTNMPCLLAGGAGAGRSQCAWHSLPPPGEAPEEERLAQAPHPHRQQVSHLRGSISPLFSQLACEKATPLSVLRSAASSLATDPPTPASSPAAGATWCRPGWSAAGCRS